MAAVVTGNKICVRGLDVNVLIESDDELIAGPIRDAWRDAAVDFPEHAECTVTVSFTPGSDVYGDSIEQILHDLSPAVTRAAIGARSGELVMLHAAALCDPTTGATAVLVAPSGTGKTTAAITLGQTFAYLTDETSGITEDGTVLAYRKPLSVIGSGPLKAQVAPSDLGMITTADRGRLAALYVLQRDPDHQGPPRVEPLETIDALAELAPQVSFLGEFERPLQRLVDVLQLVGGASQITYAEATDLEPLLSQALSGAMR